jgi:dolichol kinase
MLQVQDMAVLAIAFLILARKAMCDRNGRDWLFLLASIAGGVALALHEGVSVPAMLEGIVIFNGIVTSYHSKENYAFSALAVFFVVSFYPLVLLITQAALLGFLSGAYFFLKPNSGKASELEKKRDLVQIIAGLVLMISYSLLPMRQVVIGIVALVIIASAVGNYGVMNKRGRVSRTLYAFERKNAMLGQGAMWLAMGMLTAISFLNTDQTIAVFAAILIGDSVATLAGTAWKIPIPYNKKKSVVGTAAYFISAAAISFPFLGYAGILTALIAALVESAPRQIDDNFDTAVVLVVLIRLLSLFGIV